LGVRLPGKSSEQLDRIGEKDRRRAEQRLVPLMGEGGKISTDMTDMKRKRNAEFRWAVAATLSYALIIAVMVVFVWAMAAQFTGGS